jgi:DNA-binding LacI/PurR family transcriptional regulator
VVTTIRTVAEHAGVSPSTVSRVFARPELVAEDARRRVLASASELGYRPNPVARSLARGRTGNLGLIVPDIANPFFGPLIKSVHNQALRQDLSLFVADSDEHPAEELALARAMSKQVDGLVLASSRLSDGQIRELNGLAPVVLISRSVEGIPAVLTPPMEGLRQAVEHLRALGHEELVYLTGPAEFYSNKERTRALRQVCRKHGIPLREVGPFQPKFEAGVRAADLVLAQLATAVVAFNDQIALGLMNRLTERGYKVGTDISVVGIDDSWIARMVSPSLTTIRVPADVAGTEAVRLLAATVSSQKDTAPTVELPTELIVRGSTGPAIRDVQSA